MTALVQGATRIGPVPNNVQQQVAARQSGRWATQYQPSPQQVAALYAAAPTADPIVQLREAAGLHARGVLTDAEFASQKAIILDDSDA